MSNLNSLCVGLITQRETRLRALRESEENGRGGHRTSKCLPVPSKMTTLASLIPDALHSLQLKPVKIGGVYHKALGGRKRNLLIRTLHDPSPKKWELRQPRGVRHDAGKIARYVNFVLL